jgi:hypothetical protein
MPPPEVACAGSVLVVEDRRVISSIEALIEERDDAPKASLAAGLV